MRIRILAISLLFAVTASSSAVAVSEKRVKVIDLAAKDGSKFGAIHVDGHNLLYEFHNNSEACLFTDENFMMWNNKDKTYRVQSYNELQAIASRKAAEIAQLPDSIDTKRGVVLTLTQETDVIAGAKVHKLIKTRGGEPEAVFWISRELTPPRLLAFGEKIRSILPKDYWNKIQGNPGMIEIIMSFGVPLKLIYNGNTIYQAQSVDSSNDNNVFQVPADYKRLDN